MKNLINILYLHAGAELYGADVILLEIVKNLDKSKFKPYVILPCDGPLVDKMRQAGIEVVVKNYPILRRKYFNLNGIINYFKEFSVSLKELKCFCKEKDIHIIHSNTVAVLEGAFLGKSLGIIHIWHIHEMLENPKLLYKFLAKLMARRSHKILVVSKAVKEHWSKSGYFKNDKIFKVMHNGIDIKRFNPHNDVDYLRKEFNIRKNEKLVTFIGRINAIKGQNIFFEAMEEVMAKDWDVKALIVGSAFSGQEWRVDELVKQINNSPFKDRFIYSGFRDDAYNIHCLGDVFVLPSIKKDSFPTVVLEAMASKKPVVAFGSGGVTEMVTHGVNGYLADFANKRDLARYIYELIANDKIRNEMGDNGYKRVLNEFSSDKFKKNIEEFYLTLVYGSEKQ